MLTSQLIGRCVWLPEGGGKRGNGVPRQTHPHCQGTACGTFSQKQHFLSSQYTEYGAHQSRLLFPNPQCIMPHIYLPPFRLRSTHIRFLCCSLPFCSLTFFKNWCRTSSPICTDSKFPDPTISSKTGLVSSSIIISDSPKEIT